MAMEALLKEAFAPGVSIRDFFMKYVPKIQELERAHFSKISQVPLIISFYFEDLDERYTIELDAKRCIVEDDELSDFPLFTLVGQGASWEQVKPSLYELGVALVQSRDQLMKQLKQPITSRFVEELERKFEGCIKLKIDGVQDLSAPLELALVLNDYVLSSGAPSFEVAIHDSVIRDLAQAKVRVKDVQDSVQITGQLKLAMNLAGFLATSFDV